MKSFFAGAGLLALFACSAFAQQTHDFSSDVVTRPFAQRSYFQGGCSPGDAFEYIVPPAIPTVYLCGYSHDWNLLAGGSGGITTGIPFYTAGVGAQVSGTSSNCIHVDGTSAACPGFANPMTSVGDIIIGGSAGAATRLATSTGYLHQTGSGYVFDAPATPRPLGIIFDGGGSAITAPVTKYFTTPGPCTIGAWSMTADTGTASANIWKIATGTAIPTSANSICASACPSLATGTAARNTTLTGWGAGATVATGDIFGFSLTAVSGSPTQVSLVLECQ